MHVITIDRGLFVIKGLVLDWLSLLKILERNVWQNFEVEIWFLVASYVVTDKNKLTERDVDNDIPH